MSLENVTPNRADTVATPARATAENSPRPSIADVVKSSTSLATPGAVAGPGSEGVGVAGDPQETRTVEKKPNPLAAARDLNELKRNQEAAIKEKLGREAAEKKLADLEARLSQADELFNSKDPLKVLKKLGIHPDELVRDLATGKYQVPDETDEKLSPIQQKLKELEDFKNSVETEKRTAAEARAAEEAERQRTEAFNAQATELAGHIESLVDEYPFAASFGATAQVILQEAERRSAAGDDVDVADLVRDYNGSNQRLLQSVIGGKHSRAVLQHLFRDEAVFAAVSAAVSEARGTKGTSESDSDSQPKVEQRVGGRAPGQINAIPGNVGNEISSRQPPRMTDADRRAAVRRIGNS